MKQKQIVSSLEHKIFVVTGANSGIGFETTRILASRNATVIMACRNMKRGNAAMDKILEEYPKASLDLLELDLETSSGIDQFIDEFKIKYDELDVLINNAGLMDVPYEMTEDGIERVMAINYFGPFYLTSKLLPFLLRKKDSRIISTSSLMHRVGKIHFDDIHGEKKYNKVRQYAQSKLANLLFSYELQRIFERMNISMRSIACHPGYAVTNLQYAGNKEHSKLRYLAYKYIGNPIMGQSAEKGALSTVYASTEDIPGGSYVGPKLEFWGHPKVVKSNKRSRNAELAAKLWILSEKICDVSYSKILSETAIN